MDMIHRKIYILFFITSLFLTGCATGWSGVPEFKQDMNFSGDKKSDIIDDLGVPDSTFVKNTSEEYWLYKFTKNYYIIVFGERKVKGLIIEFSDDKVKDTFLVETGVVNEIITRGWEYGINKVIH